jgi:hypothetical protein
LPRFQTRCLLCRADDVFARLRISNARIPIGGRVRFIDCDSAVNDDDIAIQGVL